MLQANHHSHNTPRPRITNKRGKSFSRQDCSLVPVFGQQFQPGLGCRVQPVRVGETGGWVYSGPAAPVAARYRGPGRVECGVPGGLVERVRDGGEPVSLELQLGEEEEGHWVGVLVTLYTSRCHSCRPGPPLGPARCSRLPGCLARTPCSPSPCWPGVACSHQDWYFTCGTCPPGMTGDGISCYVTTLADTSTAAPTSPPPVPSPTAKPVTAPPAQDLKVVAGAVDPLCEGGQCTTTISTCSANDVHCGPADPCAARPCWPGVQCVNVRMGASAGFVCGLCPPGTAGDGRTCSASQPCGPAGPCWPGVRCREAVDSAECGACPPGTTGNGRHCQEIDDCSPSPCWPGVVCQDGPAPSRGYTCGPCPPGTRGNGLECVTVPACRRPCQHGGQCEAGDTCRCASGWRGRRCGRPRCAGGCRNGGKCVAPDRCSCEPGYSGPSCRTRQPTNQPTPIELTLTRPPDCHGRCRNGGRCRKSGRCKCRPGYSGTLCQRSGRADRKKRKRRHKASMVKQYLVQGHIKSV